MYIKGGSDTSDTNRVFFHKLPRKRNKESLWEIPTYMSLASLLSSILFFFHFFSPFLFSIFENTGDTV